MNKITQEARKRQAVVKLALRKGKSYAARMYGVSLSSVKRWVAHYDGTWQSLREKSHRPTIEHAMKKTAAYAKYHNKTSLNILEYTMYQTGNIIRLH